MTRLLILAFLIVLVSAARKEGEDENDVKELDQVTGSVLEPEIRSFHHKAHKAKGHKGYKGHKGHKGHKGLKAHKGYGVPLAQPIYYPHPVPVQKGYGVPVAKPIHHPKAHHIPVQKGYGVPVTKPIHHPKAHHIPVQKGYGIPHAKPVHHPKAHHIPVQKGYGVPHAEPVQYLEPHPHLYEDYAEYNPVPYSGGFGTHHFDKIFGNYEGHSGSYDFLKQYGVEV